MNSFKFLLSRRWVYFFIAIIVIGYGTWWLGHWQFDRLHTRKHNNAIIRANEVATPVDITKVMSTTDKLPNSQQWRRVTATGHYDTANTISLLYQTDVHSQMGFDVVVPFITDGGQRVFVDRGWIASTDQVDSPVAVPQPASGEVTIVGWARQNGSGSSTNVDSSSIGYKTRALSSDAIDKTLGTTSLRGFVDLQSETPAAATALTPTEMPDLSNGPHFFYGLQWWFFGILAVFGFFYLMYDERRTNPEDAPKPAEAAADPEPIVEPKLVIKPKPVKEPKPVDEKRRRKQAVKAAYKEAWQRERDSKAQLAGQSASSGSTADSSPRAN